MYKGMYEEDREIFYLDTDLELDLVAIRCKGLIFAKDLLSETNKLKANSKLTLVEYYPGTMDSAFGIKNTPVRFGDKNFDIQWSEGRASCRLGEEYKILFDEAQTYKDDLLLNKIGSLENFKKEVSRRVFGNYDLSKPALILDECIDSLYTATVAIQEMFKLGYKNVYFMSRDSVNKDRFPNGVVAKGIQLDLSKIVQDLEVWQHKEINDNIALVLGKNFTFDYEEYIGKMIYSRNRE